MNHSFNIEVATRYSIEEAIMLENFYFWIKKNKANDRHFYDGRYWTYNSQKALSELFPYWTRNQIQRIISKLEKNGLIVKGNYNKAAYDRTTWYSLTDKALNMLEIHIVQKSTMDCAKVNNGLCKSQQPIPDINTDINKNTNIYSSVIDYLNKKADKNYKATTQSTKTKINARLNEGFTLEDFKKVIDVKCKQWKDTDMDKYLRPQTLFGTKFEGYLNEGTSIKEEKEGNSIYDSLNVYR